MKYRFFAVIDTNVIVSAILKKGFPNEIISLIDSGNVVPVYDYRMFDEYKDVLNRDKFSFDKDIIKDILSRIEDFGILVKDVAKTKQSLKDKGDVPFFEVKEDTGELGSYLVTGNLKDFPDDPYIINSKTAIIVMNQVERYLTLDERYEEKVYSALAEFMVKDKYEPGKKLDEKINKYANKPTLKERMEKIKDSNQNQQSSKPKEFDDADLEL